MNKPLNQELYEKVKRMADAIYSKPSAYKSGYIVKAYKDLGGKYSGEKTTDGLKRWFQEKWVNLSDKDQYPTLRPSKRVSSKTPLTIHEISPAKIKKQVALKQKLRGNKNLPPF